MSKSKQAEPEAQQTHESPEVDEAFEALLLYLKQSRGFDFTAYKRSTLMRRVLVRMQTVSSRDQSGHAYQATRNSPRCSWTRSTGGVNP